MHKPINLVANEVHVWSVDLALSAEAVAALFKVLNKDEQARAERFHFPHDRARFIAARGSLRKLLSAYTPLAPEQLQFNYNAYGKPDLIQAPGLQFNLSHANTQGLIAITLAPA